MQMAASVEGRLIKWLRSQSSAQRVAKALATCGSHAEAGSESRQIISSSRHMHLALPRILQNRHHRELSV